MTYTNQIQGWISDKDLQWLYETAQKMDNIIEIGSWRGRSTHALLSGCKGLVTAVDHFEGNSNSKIEDNWIERLKAEKTTLYDEFLKNTSEFKNLRVWKMDWKEAVKTKETFDMIFIDNVLGGDEMYQNLLEEINVWKPKIKKIICGHDYQSNAPGTMKAVDELFPNRKIVDTIWYTEL